jgi:hypothetical protein
LDEPLEDNQPMLHLVEAPKQTKREGLILESDEHDQVMKWAHYQQLFVLHAGTHKAVSDLPPGWPDFSLIYSSRVCLVEMKVVYRFRLDQLRLIERLAKQDTPVFIARDSVQTIEVFKGWLLLNFGWSPK